MRPRSSYSVCSTSAWVKVKRPARSGLSCSSDAATASSSRSSSRASWRSTAASSRSRSKSRPMTAAAPRAVRASGPRRSTRRPITSRTLCGSPSSATSPDQLPASALALHDRPRLRQVAQHLAGEERIAGRLARDLPGQRAPVLVELVSRRRLHQRQHVLGVKPGELHALHALLAMKVGQQRRQRMIAREFGVAVGAHHHRWNRGAAVTMWRSSDSVGPSAQWRSSRINSSGSCSPASSSRPAAAA